MSGTTFHPPQLFGTSEQLNLLQALLQKYALYVHLHCLTRTIQIHQLSLSKPDSFAFKTNINRNLFVRSLKNYDFTFIICWHCCTSLHFIKRRGRSSPRSQAKSLHESPLQAVPVLSTLLACPLPLRLGAQPLKPGSSQIK